jgi:hypothetical protein
LNFGLVNKNTRKNLMASDTSGFRLDRAF